MRPALMLGGLAALVMALGGPSQGSRPDRAAAMLDSSGIATLLDGMGRSDPMICAMATELLGSGSFWRSDDFGIATLRGEPVAGRGLRARLETAPLAPGAARLLADSLASGNACVRRTAAALLGERGTAPARAALRLGIEHPDPAVREAAAFGLGTAADTADASLLRKSLSDPDPGVVRLAAWAIGRIGPEDATRDLVRLLRNTDPGVRRAAAWALGRAD